MKFGFFFKKKNNNNGFQGWAHTLSLETTVKMKMYGGFQYIGCLDMEGKDQCAITHHLLFNFVCKWYDVCFVGFEIKTWNDHLFLIGGSSANNSIGMIKANLIISIIKHEFDDLSEQ